MEGANSTTNWTVGYTKDLPLQVGDIMIKVHAPVIEQAIFGLLLGHLFQQATLCCFKYMPNGKVEVSVHNPADLSQRVFLSTCPCTRHAPGVKMVSVCTSLHLPLSLPSPPSLTQAIMQQALLPLLPADPETLVLKYKHVNKMVQPVPATLPEEYCTICCIPEDPLLLLLLLLMHLPDFTPGECLT